jgi:hypothetical protein
LQEFIMVSPVDDHKFNDDMLLHESDRKLAASKYPSIVHVLDHQELRHLFIEYDAPASRAKRTGLMAGLGAIGLGFFALAAAAAEITVAHSADWFTVPLAGFAGMCGLASFVVGSVGVLFASRKRDWLHHRLMAESIRQFHFQMLVFRLPRLLASMKDDAARSDFRSERKLWLESLKARMIGKLDSAFAAAIQEEEEIGPWHHDGTKAKELAKFRESSDLDPVFDAYRELRILHQLGYANYKLQNDHKFKSAMPRRQLEMLSNVVFFSIILLFIMHLGVLVGAVLPHSIWACFHSPGAIVVIIWLALAALATRAIEQGLQPEREIERYQQYRSAIRAILERYDQAPFQAAKIEFMRDMERLAFDEMRNFLITNERSRFVM